MLGSRSVAWELLPGAAWLSTIDYGLSTMDYRLLLLRNGAEDREVARGAHEEKHRDREPGVRAGGEEGATRPLGHVGRRGSARLRCRLRGGDDLLLERPDDHPDVHEHHVTHAAPDRDRDGAVASALPHVSHRSPGDEQDEDGDHDGEDASVLQGPAGDRHPQEGRHDEPRHGPGHEEDDDLARDLFRAEQDHVIEETEEEGVHGAPAEPPQCLRHQVRHNLSLARRVELLHEVDVDEIEEVKESDPGDARQEMTPPEKEQDIRLPVLRPGHGASPNRVIAVAILSQAPAALSPRPAGRSLREKWPAATARR